MTRVADGDGDPRLGWRLVWSLSVAQLVSWGAIYYSFSLFVLPMETELGWSRTEINGALSAGLLTSGLCAYSFGAWIDRHGGRTLMSAGSLTAAALLVVWSRTHSIEALYAVWIGLGAAMAATLYHPVFAVLTRAFPQSYRKRITVLTLVGGFASTIFIPLTQLLIDRFGWRGALVGLALCLALVALPVHAALLKDRNAPAVRPLAHRLGNGAVRRALRHPVFWCLVICFTAYSGTVSALTFHIIPLLTDRGVETATIIGAVAVIGPAQVLGRLILLGAGDRVTTATAGRVIMLAFPASILVLIAFPSSLAALFSFAILYGCAHGTMTIIRGTSVPDLMWREGYGAVSGMLTLPSSIANAAAPLAAAMIWSAGGGYGPVLWSMLASATVAALGFWCAAATSRVV